MAKIIFKNKENAPEVSVIMSVYNGEKYIREAIDSILAQTYKNFEFIIVNDGSTDSTLDIINSYNDRRIVIISRENRGLVASLNEGIKNASGKYIARQDADDISKKDRIETELSYLKKNKDVSVVCTYIDEIDTLGKPYKRRVMSNEVINGFMESSLLAFNPIAHGTAMFLKSKFIKAGCYREEWWPAEDYELWSRMALHGRLAVIRQTLYMFRVNPAGVSSSMRIEQEEKVFKIQKISADRLRKNLLRGHKYKVSKEVIGIYAGRHNNLKDLINILLFKIKMNVLKDTVPRILMINRSKKVGGGEVYMKEVIENLADEYKFSLMAPKDLINSLNIKGLDKKIVMPDSIFNFNYWKFSFIKRYLIDFFYFLYGLNAFQIIHYQQLDEDMLKATSNPVKFFTMHSELKTNGAVGKSIARVMNYNNEIICVSDSVAKIAEKLIGRNSKINVIYNGIGKGHLYRSGNTKIKNKIIWAGRVEKLDKNPDLFLDVAKKFMYDKNDYKFILYGEGSYIQQIKNRKYDEKISNLKIAGFENDKYAIFKDALITCITSEREAMPLVMLESFASAVPVVTTDVGDAGKIVKKFRAGKVSQPTANAFYSAIKSVLYKHDLYSRNSIGAYEREFKIDYMIEKLSKLYEINIR